MPYITQSVREDLKGVLEEFRCCLKDLNGLTKGELNYLISSMCAEAANSKPLSYSHLSDVAAALQDARDEFYRRVLAPYEDLKIEENGDVYENVLSKMSTKTVVRSGKS